MKRIEGVVPYRIKVERIAEKLVNLYPNLSYGSRVKIAKILLSETGGVTHDDQQPS